MSKVLVVGGGHAGANTAFALRKDGFDGEITIISDESYLPYHRPPLSKDFLIPIKANKTTCSLIWWQEQLRSKTLQFILIWSFNPIICLICHYMPSCSK